MLFAFVLVVCCLIALHFSVLLLVLSKSERAGGSRVGGQGSQKVPRVAKRSDTVLASSGECGRDVPGDGDTALGYPDTLPAHLGLPAAVIVQHNPIVAWCVCVL